MLALGYSDAAVINQVQTPETHIELGEMSQTALEILNATFRVAGAGLAGYHGYKRNDGRIGATLMWGAIGFLLPVLTNVFAAGQGFAQPRR